MLQVRKLVKAEIGLEPRSYFPIQCSSHSIKEKKYNQHTYTRFREGGTGNMVKELGTVMGTWEGRAESVREGREVINGEKGNWKGALGWGGSSGVPDMLIS